MKLGSRVLLVDDAPFMLEALSRILRPHVLEIETANCCASALQQIEQTGRLDLVISDVILPDGNGFKILERIAALPKSRPKVVLITARWTESDRDRAASLGAIGYLPKPISVRDLRQVLAAPGAPVGRAPRQRTLARVWVVEPDRRERLLCFDIHDISRSGMLLDTAGPLPVGTELEFEIVRGEDEMIRGRGSVVRVQEPNWLNPGGAALHFKWVDSPTKLAELIEKETQPDPVPAPGRETGSTRVTH